MIAVPLISKDQAIGFFTFNRSNQTPIRKNRSEDSQKEWVIRLLKHVNVLLLQSASVQGKNFKSLRNVEKGLRTDS
jgi:hypothetical protein